jgi:ABC-type amino acid transport system permease subunit
MEVSQMKTMRLTFSKYLWGMAASLIIGLAGGWLILAPFALGYQPYGADWVSQTTNDFATGIPVAVVALISFTFFFASLLGSLRAAGVLAARTRPETQAQAAFRPQAPMSLVPATAPGDLDRTLATLAAALATDLSARREARSDQVSNQSIEQSVTRRES